MKMFKMYLARILPSVFRLQFRGGFDENKVLNKWHKMWDSKVQKSSDNSLLYAGDCLGQLKWDIPDMIVIKGCETPKL